MMVRMLARGFAAGAVAIGVALSALAQDFPARPVRLIVPFSPGGATDILARALGQKLSEQWRQQVVIDNRPGAAGNIGAELVARATPDGYTLLMGFDGTLTINPSVYAKLPFDPVRDFAPITRVADVPIIIVAYPGLAAGTVKEVAALARSKPASVNYASAGVGSTPHLAGVLLGIAADAPMTHVPYKGGGQALSDLMGGQIQLLFIAIPAVQSYIRSGRMKAIAVTTARRSPALPEVPTVAESGYPGFDVATWYGLLAPAGTPAKTVSKLQTDIAAVLASADMKERLFSLGANPVGNSSQQFTRDIRHDLDKWSKLVKQAGIHVE